VLQDLFVMSVSISQSYFTLMSRAHIVLTVLSLSVFVDSTSARSMSETVNVGSPWFSLALTMVFAAVLYVAMTWGDKRESYKS
jgi:hypothetical protein